MACGAAEQLGVVWWVVWVVWGCGLAVGGSFLSRSRPPWKGAIKGGETGQKKICASRGWGKRGQGAGIQAGCGSI